MTQDQEKLATAAKAIGVARRFTDELKTAIAALDLKEADALELFDIIVENTSGYYADRDMGLYAVFVTAASRNPPSVLAFDTKARLNSDLDEAVNDYTRIDPEDEAADIADYRNDMDKGN